jgi:hypothetical protein
MIKLRDKCIAFAVISIFTLFFTINLHLNSSDSSKSFLKTSLKYNSITKIAGLANRVFSFEDSEDQDSKPVPVNNKTKNNDLIKTVFFNLSALMVSNNNILPFVLILFAGLLLLDVKKSFEKHSRGLLKPPDIVFYKNWILKFITPMEKCLHSRADEYDINPLNIVLWEITRTFYSSRVQSAGFFYVFSHEFTRMNTNKL